MKYLFQFGIIAFICFLGEILHKLIPLPIPASIYGLILLFLCLIFRIIKPSQIEKAADFLLGIMTILFLPAVVGLIPAWADLKNMLLPAILTITLTTFIVMGVTGKTAEIIIKNGRKKEEDK
ncbi:MAG: CidA/LrgA family protein [Christensenellaceae bacterium]|nr:CidA/LrgA family protein [Christensenellaceae bacterium]